MTSLATACEPVDGGADRVAVLSREEIRTVVGSFQQVGFRLPDEQRVHIALTLGEVAGDDVITRVHSECLTGDVFGSRKCDCGEQLQAAMSAVSAAGRGVIVYLRGHEGRGIGLINKLKAYALQQAGLDTVDANIALGLPVDARDYRAASGVLRELGVRSVALLTNNPDKVEHLAHAGIRCVRTIPMRSASHEHNHRYLQTKVDRLGHSGLIDLPLGEIA